jgi:hypothetical protein
VTQIFLIALLFFQQVSLEQQARQALDKADKALTEAKSANAGHDLEKVKALVQEMLNDLVLAEKALADTGKDARKRPKQFKYGETKTREMLKRIDSLENDMDIDDREQVAAAKVKVQEIHDEWLLGIMGAK